MVSADDRVSLPFRRGRGLGRGGIFIGIAPLSSGGLKVKSNSPLKKPPGEGTGATIHLDFRGNLVGRVPSRGEPDVFEQAANDLAASCRQIVRSRIVSLCRQDAGSTPNKYGPSLRSLHCNSRNCSHAAMKFRSALLPSSPRDGGVGRGPRRGAMRIGSGWLRLCRAAFFAVYELPFSG